MPEQNVTTKFKVDISDLKKGIADANKSIKLANAEFKNATAGLDDWSKSADGLTAKIKQQNTVVDAEKKKLDLLKQQLDRLNKSQQDGEKIIADLTAKYDDAVKTYGATSEQAKKYAKQLSDAKAAQERNTKAADDLNIKIINQDTAVKNAAAQVDKYETALADLNRSSGTAAGATENLTDKVQRQQKELDDLKTKYKNVAAEQGTTSDEARDLAAQISDLSGELKENRDKLDEAADAADDLDKSLENAGESAEDAANGGFTVFKGVLANLITNVIGKLIDSVTDLAGEAISASDSMAKFEQTMGFAGYDDKTIKEASDNVKDYADRTVYELDTIANTTAQLAANGIKDYNGLTQAAGNLNAVAGGNADTFNSVAMVLTQTAGAGKLTTENWNQLANAIPGASGRLQEALKAAGAYTGDFREAMANGQITADEFNAAIMQLGNEPVAVEAATSVSTFEGAMGNLEATAVSGIMRIYDAIGRENVAKAITKVSDLIAKIIPPIETAVTWLIDHIPEITAVVVGLATATAVYLGYTTAVQIMTNGFMSLSIAQKAVAAAQKILNVVMAANPIGLIIAAVAGLVAAFVLLWNKSEKFRNFWIGLWEKIKKAVKPVIDFVVKNFTEAWDKIKTVWAVVSAFFKKIWDGIKAVFSTVANFFKEKFETAWLVIKTIWDAVTGFFSGIWEGIKKVFANVVLFFSDIFEKVSNAIHTVVDPWVEIFRRVWELIKEVFANVVDWFKEKFETAVAVIKLVWGAVTDFFQGIWDGIKSIFEPVIDWFKEKFETAWLVIKAVWSVVKDFFSNIWEGIKTTFSNVGGWFKDKFTTAVNNIKAVFGAVKNFFSGVWDGIKSVFGNVAGWFKEKFSDAWQKVKDVFSTGGKIFDGIKDGILNGLKSVINAIIRGINKVISVPFNGLNAALRKIKSISILDVKPFDWINEIGVPQIPELEKGGILKRGQVGLLEGNGAEAVVPLEKNTGGLRKIAGMIADDMKKTGAIIRGNDNKEIVNNYNFNQTNNSPKALSRYEIYRQTKNLINAAKGV